MGRDVSAIEISVEVRRKTQAEADELHALGATLFTVGISGPRHDLAVVSDWLAWRDAINAP